MRQMFLILALALFALPGVAVEPDEILSDPVLEARARELSKGLRCLVCRNENIDESNAQLARDLRLFVRERLVAGDTDAQVLDHVVDSYGEFALLQPRATGANLLLWIAGPAMFLIALGVGGAFVLGRRKAGQTAPKALSAEEEARLKEILNS